MRTAYVPSPEFTKLTFEEVKRKARYGHKDWICWTDRQGVKRNAPKSLPAMKQCLLDSGTHGFWFIVCASDATLMRGFWRMGLIILNQLKRGAE